MINLMIAIAAVCPIVLISDSVLVYGNLISIMNIFVFLFTNYLSTYLFFYVLICIVILKRRSLNKEIIEKYW